MSEIIDILSYQAADCPFVTVNNAQPYKNLEYINPAATIKDLYSAGGDNIFQRGDNFSILSAGIILPEFFTVWKNRGDILIPFPIIRLYMIGNTTGRDFGIDVLAINPNINIPMENHELSLDVFCEVLKAKWITNPAILCNEPVRLQVNLPTFPISMTGTPASLNTKKMTIQPFLKVLHNFPMTR